jgi:uncharacterized protein
LKSHLAIMLWAASPDASHLCATPFFHAAAAAAMDVEVEIHFSSKSVLLLVDGVAEKLFAGVDREVSIYQHMQQAVHFGARLYACSDALAAHGLEHKALISEVGGIAGATAFMGRVLDPEWATLVF